MNVLYKAIQQSWTVGLRRSPWSTFLKWKFGVGARFFRTDFVLVWRLFLPNLYSFYTLVEGSEVNLDSSDSVFPKNCFSIESIMKIKRMVLKEVRLITTYPLSVTHSIMFQIICILSSGWPKWQAQNFVFGVPAFCVPTVLFSQVGTLDSLGITKLGTYFLSMFYARILAFFVFSFQN